MPFAELVDRSAASPLSTSISGGENLIVETGASVSVPAAELEGVIKIIGEYEAKTRGAA
jgi:hypothetical protein